MDDLAASNVDWIGAAGGPGLLASVGMFAT
jgi:hypothetical protein